jgi:glycosyltransferase involved in cell wall biosynthesis
MDPEGPELLTHALAQTPDDVSLEICGTSDAARLSLLAHAYGIEGRLSLPTETNGNPLAPCVPPRNASFAEVVEWLGRPGRAAVRRGKDSVLGGQRVLLVTNIPAHYRIPLFNGMQARLDAAGAAFRVLFLARGTRSRSHMRPQNLCFEHEFLRSIELPFSESRRFVPLSLGSRVRSFAPTLILSAGFSPLVSLPLARIARETRVPFGLWSGDIPSRPTAQSHARRRLRQRITSEATFAIAYGSLSAQYLRSLNRDLPLVYGRNTTRTDEPPSRRDHVEDLSVLTVGRAYRGKSLETVVEAVRQLRGLPLRLTVVGAGPVLSALRATARGDKRIEFVGEIPSDQVDGFYRRAQIFAFPSRYDVFGISLVEAMAAGLAPIVSNAPGAVPDLCVPGTNSVVLDSQHPSAWADALRELVEDRALRLDLGRAAARTIRARWTIEHASDAMVAGLRLGVLATARGLPMPSAAVGLR